MVALGSIIFNHNFALMKAKMTVYQKGGKMPANQQKAELAKELFGEMPKFDKNKVRKEMMTEKLNKLQKEYDYWTKKGEPTSASGVKVQMDKIREDIKKFAGGGKMNVAGATSEDQYKYMGYSKGGKMDKYGKGGMMKYLKGGQMKLDANKDGKISSVDFKMLKKK